ncbi:hypothetical protein H0V99_01715 [Candidatus Saccharibacteria bacterium]|nr:hypothetical protein [Candidatus Saccharibacteria bacterium]
MANNRTGKSKRGLASADKATRERVARAGGKARQSNRTDSMPSNDTDSDSMNMLS